MRVLRDEVRAFILSNFYVSDPAALADDDSLLDRGIIDSTGVLELLAFLDRSFDVTVSDEETTPENLDSIARIAAFVGRKLGRLEPHADAA